MYDIGDLSLGLVIITPGKNQKSAVTPALERTNKQPRYSLMRKMDLSATKIYIFWLYFIIHKYLSYFDYMLLYKYLSYFDLILLYINIWVVERLLYDNVWTQLWIFDCNGHNNIFVCHGNLHGHSCSPSFIMLLLVQVSEMQVRSVTRFNTSPNPILHPCYLVCKFKGK